MSGYFHPEWQKCYFIYIPMTLINPKGGDERSGSYEGRYVLEDEMEQRKK